jgi:hypothetical protein
MYFISSVSEKVAPEKEFELQFASKTLDQEL